MSHDTDYLTNEDFYIDADQNLLRLKISEEYQKNALVLFVKEKEDGLVKNFKEMLKTERYLAICFLTENIREMINKSSAFVMNGYIIRFVDGKETKKISFTNNLNS